MKENILLNEKGNLQNNVEVDSVFLKYFLKALKVTILGKVSNWHIGLVRGRHLLTCMEPKGAQTLVNLIDRDLSRVAPDTPWGVPWLLLFMEMVFYSSVPGTHSLITV